MNLTNKIKKFENLHIVFWLIKDTCWMLEIKWLGALMVLPTLGMAIRIIYHTRATAEVLINYAILAWITANSFWMLAEFFNNSQYKNLAGIPFAIGISFAAAYYIRVRTPCIR